MGVLNATSKGSPDGDRDGEPDRAVARGRQLFAAGADLVEVKAGPDELRRAIPVIEELAGCGRVSVATNDGSVARLAVAAGAGILHDTGGILHDSDILHDSGGALWPVAAECGVGWVGVHSPTSPAAAGPEEVRAALVSMAERASAAGVAEVWIDPGIGVSKTAEQDFALLHSLSRLVATGWPVAVGAREQGWGREGLEASLTTLAWAVLQGAAMVRTCDVTATAMAIRLAGFAEGRDEQERVRKHAPAGENEVAAEGLT